MSAMAELHARLTAAGLDPEGLSDETVEQIGYYLAEVPDATPGQLHEAVTDYLAELADACQETDRFGGQCVYRGGHSAVMGHRFAGGDEAARFNAAREAWIHEPGKPERIIW